MIFLADGGNWCPELCPPTLPGELCQPPQAQGTSWVGLLAHCGQTDTPPAGRACPWEGRSTGFSKHARKTSQKLGKSFSSCTFYRDLHRDQRPFMARKSFALIK